MARHRSFDYEQARRLFEEGASLETIGLRFGVTPAAARYAIRQAGSPARSRTYDHELIRRLDSEGGLDPTFVQPGAMNLA